MSPSPFESAALLHRRRLLYLFSQMFDGFDWRFATTIRLVAPSCTLCWNDSAEERRKSANFCRRPHPLLCSTTASLHAAGYNWSSAQIRSHNHAHSRTQRLKHTHARMFGKIVHITNTLLRIKCAFFYPLLLSFQTIEITTCK